MNHLPAWIERLEDEDLAFAKRFVLASGSLKEVAALGSAAETVGTILLVLVTCNIPALVLLLIYKVRRRKFSRARETEKMNIADL